MKKIDVFPEFSLCKEYTTLSKKVDPNTLGVYNYKDFFITVYNDNGLKSLSINNPYNNKIEDDVLESIAIHFIGLNYKIKTNYTIQEIKDDNN